MSKANLETVLAYDSGRESSLEDLYEWIVSGIEETDEIALVLRYIEAELGWEGDEDTDEDSTD